MPSYINLKVANKILFTGELLQLFRSRQGAPDAAEPENARLPDPSAASELTFMGEKLDQFSKEIYEISKLEFSIISFEELMNKMRNHVSEVRVKLYLILTL